MISAYKSKDEQYFLSLPMNLRSLALLMMFVTKFSSGHRLYLFQNISVLYWGCVTTDDEDEEDPELTDEEKLDTEEALERNENVERRGLSLTTGFLCMVSWCCIRLSLFLVSKSQRSQEYLGYDGIWTELHLALELAAAELLLILMIILPSLQESVMFGGEY